MFYIIVILAAIFAMPAKADETLKWRDVQHSGSNQTLQASDVPGHVQSVYRLPGIAFFSDGSTGTVGIKVGSFPTPGLYSMVDELGTPHSPALHVVERYRLLDHETAKVTEERNEKDNVSQPMTDAGIARDPNYQGKGWSWN
jgi:hypothetical protein